MTGDVHPPAVPPASASWAPPDGAAAEEEAATALARRAPPAAVASPATVASRSPYAGLATRTIAFAADAAVIDGVILAVGIVAGLALSLFNLPSAVTAVLVAGGAVAAAVWMVGYFVVFWSATGQTPGNRLMEVRVQDARTGARLAPRQALARALLIPVSVIPFCAGILLILVDLRRRALHDRIAGTVVVDASDPVRRPRRGKAAPP